MSLQRRESDTDASNDTEQTADAMENSLVASVTQETRAKVDGLHPDAHSEMGPDLHGQSLAQRERIQAREAELERISARAELGADDRGERTREAVVSQCGRTTREDPRERLTKDELAAVNQQAARLVTTVEGGPGRAAIARQLAERVVGGQDVQTAALALLDDLKSASGVVVPIGELETVAAREVTVEGKIVDLWETEHSAIQQVGLIADASGQTKLTVWSKSDQPMVAEGQRVRIRSAAKNQHRGRCSIALTSESTIVFPERGRWWE